jgi:glutathione S-transferase
MILIGRYFSPFVRRVGTALAHYGIEFEHRPLRAAGDEQDVIRESSPLGRVPVLILDNGDVLSDSALILDYLDTLAPRSASLVPHTGEEDRFRFLNALSVATGAAEKSIAVFSELGRPEERRHGPALEKASQQTRDGLGWLEARVTGPWMWGESLTHLDVSTVCYWDFIRIGVPGLFATLDCPRIADIAARTGELDAFRKTVPVP